MSGDMDRVGVVKAGVRKRGCGWSEWKLNLTLLEQVIADGGTHVVDRQLGDELAKKVAVREHLKCCMDLGKDDGQA